MSRDLDAAREMIERAFPSRERVAKEAGARVIAEIAASWQASLQRMQELLQELEEMERQHPELFAEEQP